MTLIEKNNNAAKQQRAYTGLLDRNESSSKSREVMFPAWCCHVCCVRDTILSDGAGPGRRQPPTHLFTPCPSTPALARWTSRSIQNSVVDTHKDDVLDSNNPLHIFDSSPFFIAQTNRSPCVTRPDTFAITAPPLDRHPLLLSCSSVLWPTSLAPSRSNLFASDSLRTPFRLLYRPRELPRHADRPVRHRHEPPQQGSAAAQR